MPLNGTNSAYFAWHNRRLNRLEAIASLMRSRLVRKFGSLIGMFAILMTMFAPAVSQALVQNARNIASTNAIFSVHCSTVVVAQPRGQNHAHTQHSTAGHRDACGYCSFAAHSPAAPSSINALPSRKVAAIAPVSEPSYDVAPFEPVFAPQPRAPPFSI